MFDRVSLINSLYSKKDSQYNGQKRKAENTNYVYVIQSI